MKSTIESPVPPPRNKSNLVTLGSVAVLAVYAAGFVRTRAAAQRFANDSDRRQVTAPTTPADTTHVAMVPLRVDTAPPPKPHKAAAAAAVAVTPAVPNPPSVDTQRPMMIAPAPAPEPPPVAPVTVVADTVPTPVDKPLARWKDGTYLGYGTSRHGDIQASVEIKDGRIIAASITQCLTRYSCSWISHLPPQVVARQSADVDYVSGATQSSNAFYQAIAEALTKAK